MCDVCLRVNNSNIRPEKLILQVKPSVSWIRLVMGQVGPLANCRPALTRNAAVVFGRGYLVCPRSTDSSIFPPRSKAVCFQDSREQNICTWWEYPQTEQTWWSHQLPCFNSVYADRAMRAARKLRKMPHRLLWEVEKRRGGCFQWAVPALCECTPFIQTRLDEPQWGLRVCEHFEWCVIALISTIVTKQICASLF